MATHRTIRPFLFSSVFLLTPLPVSARLTIIYCTLTHCHRQVPLDTVMEMGESSQSLLQLSQAQFSQSHYQLKQVGTLEGPCSVPMALVPSLTIHRDFICDVI